MIPFLPETLWVPVAKEDSILIHHLPAYYYPQL
jgi:hypothetical protein